ncbi:MAG: acyl-CoA desaturase, partial [Chitinophagaceae bacterium]
MALPKFSSGTGSFHAELKKRIQDYFATSGNTPTGNYKLFIKGAVLATAFVALYVHLVVFTPIAWIA